MVTKKGRVRERHTSQGTKGDRLYERGRGRRDAEGWRSGSNGLIDNSKKSIDKLTVEESEEECHLGKGWGRG